MAVYKIAGLTVEYDCIYNTLKQRSEKYLCNETKADIKLRLDDNYFKLKRQTFPDMSDELLEYMGIGTAFYKELLNFGGMMLHASAVAFDDEAYLFAAPSGTGKSTHTQKWTEVFDGAEIINDDKPAVRKIDGRYFAFGTPFSGKHDISVNSGFLVKAICFLDRGENKIESVTPEAALNPLFNLTIRPADESKMDSLCKIVDDMLESIPFYAMHCDISEAAVKMAYNKMYTKENDCDYEN